MRMPGARSPSRAKLMAMRWSSIGLDRRRRAAIRAGRRSRPRSRRRSMPQRRSSATTAAMRSVSWPRMKPTPRTVVGPSANTATAARVWATSGSCDQVDVDAVQLAGATNLGVVGALLDLGPHLPEQLDEAEVALPRARAQPVDPDPAPDDGRRREQVRGRGRVRLDGVRGHGRVAAAGDARTGPQPSRSAPAPNARMTCAVSSTYGAETRPSLTRMDEPVAVAGRRQHQTGDELARHRPRRPRPRIR